MAKTNLSLEVSTGLNKKVMRIFDTSFYHPDDIIDNYLIEVLPANKSTWSTFNVAENFSLVLNASNLRYKKVNDEEDLIDLPDGIYEIKQSYKPNILKVVHFLHLRTTDLESDLKVEKASLLTNKCDYSYQEYIQKRDKLRDIEEYIFGAKWLVEEEHEKEKGIDMYEFAKELLKSYTNECKC